MTPKTWRILALAAATSVPLFIVVGCTPKLAIEGGDKPIKIDMTVTLKVDRELDQFFDFEDEARHPASQPAATAPMATPPAQPSTPPPPPENAPATEGGAL